jgi:hypothetical protein
MRVYGKLLALAVYYIVCYSFHFRVDESGGECLRAMKYLSVAILCYMGLF